MQVIDLKTGFRGQQIEVMEGDGEELPAASNWILPSAEFCGLWENLISDFTIKENLNL